MAYLAIILIGGFFLLTFAAKLWLFFLFISWAGAWSLVFFMIAGIIVFYLWLADQPKAINEPRASMAEWNRH